MNRNIYFTVLVITCFYCFDAIGQTINRGPYLQSVATESIYIKWRTDVPTDSKVWYGDSPNNLNFSSYLSGSILNHEIKVHGLVSNTTYYYAVGNGNGQMVGADSSHFFITAPAAATPQTIRAWVLGDAGTANDNQRAVRDAFYNYTGNEHAQMILLLGDNAYQDGTDSEYQLAWFENMYEANLINSVMWPTFGNHDGRSSVSVTQTGPYYNIFTLPKNGQAGGTASGTEAYYSFDYGNIHFVSLNSDDIDRSVDGEMLQWLENDLNSTTKDWKVVYFHHAPYTGEGGNDSDVSLRAKEMRQNALPIIEAAGVDLVLGGHTHAYQRSYMIKGHYGLSSTWDPDSMGVNLGDGRMDGDGPYIKNIGAPSGNEGTVYVVAGSSGKLDLDDYNHPVMYHNAEKLGSVVIEVNELQMDVKFIDADSLVNDYFTIIKQGSPPVVNITNPSNNDYFDAPQTINITADASDPNGSVAEVEFFIDNVSIGIDNTSPYSVDWDAPAEGVYAIKAMATDNEDNIAFSVISIQIGPSSVCSQIDNGSDDAEEKANGTVSLTSGDLELVHDGTNQIIGLRFLNLDIPQCAVINEAFIQFTTDEPVNVNPCTIQIYGQASDNAATFKSVNGDLGNRPNTVASFTWSPANWLIPGESGPGQKTINIAAVLQEIVEREGFTPNSSIVILMEGIGRRVAKSFNGNSGASPTICVEYIPYGPDDDDDGTCNANDLCPGIPEPGSPCNDGNPGTYNDAIDSNCDCVGIPYDCQTFPANIGDECNDGDAGTYDDIIDSNCNCVGIPYDCPMIPANIGDFCDDNIPGTYNDTLDSNCNCTGILYDCTEILANIGDACDDDNPNSVNDTIDSNCNCVGIFYDCPNVPGDIGDTCDDGDPNSVNDVIDEFCVCLGVTTVNSTVSNNNDDAEENQAGVVSLTSSDLELIIDGNDVQTVGLRFINLDIPKGSIIESAFLQFTADQINNINPCVLEIFGEANDNPVTFAGNAHNITNRPKTGSSVNWSPANWPTIGESGPAQKSDNISTIIQEIVDRDGYTSASSIAIILEGTGKRTAVSRDGSSSNAPKLIVSYKCKDLNDDGYCDTCPGGSEPGAPCNDGDSGTYNDIVDENCDCVGIPYDCPLIPANIGDACNDGNPNTINDVINSNCNCIGIFYDCPLIPANIGDPCNDGDPNTSNDVITSNCGCEGTYDCPSIPANIGDACNDGNPNTSNDVITSNCECMGSYDCPSIPANIGDPCNDGNPGTYNDTVNSNCDCAGIPYDCPSILANIGDSCDDGNPNTPNDVITSNCECMGTYDCPSLQANIGDSCNDGDSETFNDIVDSNCICVGEAYDCPNIPANISDPCDDGNPNTANDEITSNCECIGTYDCPSIPGNIGDPCDDGNPNTANDEITSNCECLGTYDCPSLQANIGDSCNDGNAGTHNDAIDSNCNCIGIPYDCPEIQANIGDPCNDNNPNTSNDMITSNCACLGSYDCPNIPANIGDSCNDGNPNTSNDVITANCVCLGSYDCPSLSLNIGDPCNDDDQGTYNDTVDSNCNCVGIAFDCPNIPGNIGDPCNDGNPNSSNDVIDENCFCLGSITTVSSVNKSSDDAEEKLNGTVSTTSSDIELIKDGTVNQTIGLRFLNLNIPQGAQIDFAFIQFTADQTNNLNPCNLEIFGQASDNTTTFVNSSFNITNRPKTIESLPWSPANWLIVGEAGPAQQTVNVASIIQEIVDRSGYTSNSSIVIIIEGTGRRTAVAYDGLPSKAAKLIITYKCSDGNNDGICDECPGGPQPGDPCNDGDPGTYDDTTAANCDCIGIPYDCPAFPGNIGDSCNDGNPNTANDVITSNCGCAGTYDCPSIPANIGDPCDDGNPETSNDVITSNCACLGSYDCPELLANIGDLCNDNNPGTYDDLVDSNCNCVGIPFDCPSFPANIGDSCNDGNPETANDVITSNCQCAGSYECPNLQANIGDPCDDGNPETSNDTITSNCQCVGTYDCPSIPANIGDPCNDNDPLTYNDEINSSCLCEGIPYDCPSIPANIGDNCNDNDPGTIDDQIDQNCDCVGTPLVNNSVCKRISASSDDAEEKANGSINLTSSDLELIFDGTTQTVGLRFVNLNIPKGAIIASADIQFTVDQTDNVNPCNLTIYGQASDNAATFAGNFNISTRPKTTSSASWSPANWLNIGDAGPAQQTVDIASLIQEIVDRGGYTSNSAIAIIIQGSGKRTAKSFNTNPNLAPQLCVEYFDPPQGFAGNSGSGVVETEDQLGILNESNDRSVLNYSEVNIYPNPATDKLVVSFKSGKEDKVNIQIMDTNGRLILEERNDVNVGNNAILLDNLGLKNGIYFIRLSFDKKVYSSKFTILY